MRQQGQIEPCAYARDENFFALQLLQALPAQPGKCRGRDEVVKRRE